VTHCLDSVTKICQRYARNGPTVDAAAGVEPGKNLRGTRLHALGSTGLGVL
jgi:hypothetical protein